MKTCGKIVLMLMIISLAGCDLSGDDNGIFVFSESFDFSHSQNNWTADFTDYPSGTDDSAFYELRFAYTDRPENLGTHKKSMMLSGCNHSDDLFMFLKRKMTNLTPNTDYAIVFEVELASNAPKGAVGIGGAPGEGVYLKAGASSTEPKKVIEGNQYTLNINKGNQSTPGENTVVLGDIAVDYETKEYTLITRTNASVNSSPFVAKSNSKGELWLMVGTDSGFEGNTAVYYTKINVVLSTSQ